MCDAWGNNAAYEVDKGIQLHEANYLKLDCSKAKIKLNWQPNWNLEQALEKIIEWVHAYQKQADMRDICLQQIQEYVKTYNGEVE